MNQNQLTTLLEQLVSGNLSVTDAVDKLKHLPFEDLGIARIDHHRELRQGVAEIILGQSKTLDQLATIVAALERKQRNILVTRLDQTKGEALTRQFPAGEYDELART
ncbi:MAG TPA: 1-(5-phosphoribosyl)-5-amino-4-imidazole-carboxylate carboxylase, partial [Pelovirga sp.]|nr:1-(5-phosphoribosyl)-5-amino-4-imidazole-carboxylate carboxylase [Pelovirga sp.]